MLQVLNLMLCVIFFRTLDAIFKISVFMFKFEKLFWNKLSWKIVKSKNRENLGTTWKKVLLSSRIKFSQHQGFCAYRKRLRKQKIPRVITTYESKKMTPRYYYAIHSFLQVRLLQMTLLKDCESRRYLALLLHMSVRKWHALRSGKLQPSKIFTRSNCLLKWDVNTYLLKTL